MNRTLARHLVACACALAVPAANAQVAAAPRWGAASSPWSATPGSAIRPVAPPAALPAAPGTPLQRPGAKPAAPAGAVRTIHVPLAAATPPSGTALQAANQSVLAEARGDAAPVGPTSAPQDQVVRRFGSSRSNEALPTTAAALACRTPLAIGAPRGTLTPGGLIYVRGCDLGSVRGELRMVGRFDGGLVRLEVQEWTPKLVIASVPETLRGVDDQPVRLQLSMRDGKVSNEQAARFLARRETVLLPESLVAVTNCAHPQPSECGAREVQPYPGRWFVGLHHGSDSQAGRDEWRLSIGPNWQLERVDSWQGLGVIDVTPQARGAGGALVLANWRSVQDPHAFESSEWMFQAQYGLRFYVTGPAGVAFSTGIN